MSDIVKARLLLVGLCLAWGLTWPAMWIALADFPPFTMRTIAATIGAAAMFALAAAAGRPIRVPHRSLWTYIAIVAFFNIVMFSVCVAYAQLHTMTGRVAILVYTMPIWSSLLSWLLIGERLTRFTSVALLLCCAGMAVLVYPLAIEGIPLGILLALAASWCWAIGTIYIKRSSKQVEPFTLAAWQLIISLVTMLALALTIENMAEIRNATWTGWAGVAFAGFFGSAIAYYLWFQIIRLLPASTASLGALSAPVIGIISSVFLLGEVPTTTDVIGFTLIFAASFCALLQPHVPLPTREA